MLLRAGTHAQALTTRYRREISLPEDLFSWLAKGLVRTSFPGAETYYMQSIGFDKARASTFMLAPYFFAMRLIYVDGVCVTRICNDFHLARTTIFL